MAWARFQSNVNTCWRVLFWVRTLLRLRGRQLWVSISKSNPPLLTLPQVKFLHIKGWYQGIFTNFPSEQPNWKCWKLGRCKQLSSPPRPTGSHGLDFLLFLNSSSIPCTYFNFKFKLTRWSLLSITISSSISTSALKQNYFFKHFFWIGKTERWEAWWCFKHFSCFATSGWESFAGSHSSTCGSSQVLEDRSAK